MVDLDFEVFVRVDFTGVAVQCEGFPLGRMGGIGDKFGEGVVVSDWWGGSGWRGMGCWIRLGKVEVKM